MADLRRVIEASLGGVDRATQAQGLLQEIAKRAARSSRAERITRGLVDTRWFLAYYMPHMFPMAFGRHHEEIIDDFDAMIGQAVEISKRTQLTGMRHDVSDDDLDVGESKELNEDEWQALLGEDGVGTVPFSAAYACPREHGKSTLLVGLAVKAVVHKLRRFLLFIGDTIDQGEARLGEVKAEIEQNERLREDFGDLIGKRRWQIQDAVTSTGIRLRAYGTGSKIRGAKHGAYRPDFAVVDDGENDEAVETEALRRKTRLWLTKVLMNAIDSDHGLLYVVGTILHYDSLLSRLVGKEHFTGWIKRRYRALEGLGKPGEMLHSLWPGKWPVPKLLRKRSVETGIGPVAFDSEFQNDPVSDDTSAVKMVDLIACRERGRGRRFVESYDEILHWLGVEPLILLYAWDFGWVDTKERAEQTDSNYTAGVCIAVHPVTRHRYLMRVAHDRGLNPDEIRRLVKVEASIIRPPAESSVWERFRVVVESVGLQRQLYAVGLEVSSDLPIAAVHTDRRKTDPFEGLPRISVLVLGHQYVLPWPDGEDAETIKQRECVQALINELYGLGREAHDDLVLALWFAEVIIGKMLGVLDRALREAGTPWVRPDAEILPGELEQAQPIAIETKAEADRRKQHERSKPVRNKGSIRSQKRW